MLLSRCCQHFLCKTKVLSSITTLKNNCHLQPTLWSALLHPASFSSQVNPHQNNHLTSTTATLTPSTDFPAPVLEDSVQYLEKDTLRKTVNKILHRPFRQTNIKRAAYYTYEQCTDPLDLAEFFTYFKLSDTFYSWFLVMELHVWMCSSRFMQEGFDGNYARDELLHSMWKDVEKRMQLLDVSRKIRRKSLETLTKHFLAALASYDEAIVTDDRCLAGALWRIFFSSECDDAQIMETLVHYVRHQLYMLDNLDNEQLFFHEGQSLQWTPLSEIVKATNIIANSSQESIV